MERRKKWYFEDFCLDMDNSLWRGKEQIKLTPKALEVLRHLVEHAGQLISNEELSQACWDTVVGNSTFATNISTIRKALGDNRKNPCFIRTIPKRGYQFIAELREQPLAVGGQQKDGENVSPASNIVGRGTELVYLEGLLGQALAGRRRLVFVSGEEGIGKTTVVDAFIEKARARGEFWIGHGQCIDLYGTGEAYMPMLEAFVRLCRQSEGQKLVTLLDQHAPSWLVQMTSVLDPQTSEALQQKMLWNTRRGMLREMAEAIEALTTQRPLILVLEDLQWSDHSTLDLLVYLARRREPARLLMIGTYRPVEAIVGEHPLRKVKQELQLHGQCEELLLEYLGEEAVREYLCQRFAVSAIPPSLLSLIHKKTDGNPLFMVTLVATLVSQGAIAVGQAGVKLQDEEEAIARVIPESLRELIERQLGEVSAKGRELLEAGSVVGERFSAPAVAAGIGTKIEEVEELCDALMKRGQFLRANEPEDWPDGTIASQYSFLHALYKEVLYEGLRVQRRRQLHQSIGERLEAGYGQLTEQIYAELAKHFQFGGDSQKAFQYRTLAGDQAATKKYAYKEAIDHFEEAIKLLPPIDSPERQRQECTLQLSLGSLGVAREGYASKYAKNAYDRALDLCPQKDGYRERFRALWGLWIWHTVQGKLQEATSLASDLEELARSQKGLADLLIEAQCALGMTEFFKGNLVGARASLEKGIELYDPQTHGSHANHYGQDPKVFCLSLESWALWMLGYPDQAKRKSQEALMIVEAPDSPHPPTLAFAHFFIAHLYLLCGERSAAKKHAQEVMKFSQDYEFSFWRGGALFLLGWLSVMEQGASGLTEMDKGMEEWKRTGAEIGRSYHQSRYCEANKEIGQLEEGLRAFDNGLEFVETNGEQYYEAELHRLKGDLLLVGKAECPEAKGENPNFLEAEECFRHAIAIARRQKAKSHELRATISLSRLLQQQGKKLEAHKMLSKIYNWFTEGFDTKDLQEARALLEELLAV